MRDYSPRTARGFGLSLAVVLVSGLAFGGLAVAQVPYNASDTSYPPNGTLIPPVTNSEDPSGAFDETFEQAAPKVPNGWNSQSIWNMQVLGFNDNQGRPIYQPLVVNQNGREILYTGNLAGTAFNPLTGATEQNGTSIIDVTNAAHPVFLYHIPATLPLGTNTQGRQMVRVCDGTKLASAPGGSSSTVGHWYALLTNGNSGLNVAQEVWDVTNSSAPFLLKTILANGHNTHKSWWECDTGIAYIVFGGADGWMNGGGQHQYIYNLANPNAPVFIRQFGLPGQQPGFPATGLSCENAPSSLCYEGSTNPPGQIHGPISAGASVNRVYMPYGVGSAGVIQIVDRNKLLTGCTVATASASCANNPTQADLLYPQVSYLTMNPDQGGHSAVPVLGVPMPDEQSGFKNGSPQKWDLLIAVSESGGCFGIAPHEAWILNITNDTFPWPTSTMYVPQSPGDFCEKNFRFGAHAATEAVYAPYYGRIIGVSWFNAGGRLWDIRDPKQPKPIAYFIQAPNANTVATCETIDFAGNTECRNAISNDYVETDDRGYWYAVDRAGSGITILQLINNAVKVVNGD